MWSTSNRCWAFEVRVPIANASPGELVWFWRGKLRNTTAHLAPFGLRVTGAWTTWSAENGYVPPLSDPEEPLCGAPAYVREHHEFWRTQSPEMIQATNNGNLCPRCVMVLMVQYGYIFTE